MRRMSGLILLSQYDHIKPRSQNGTDQITNLQLLCGACNSTKGNRPQPYLIDRLKEDRILR